MPELPEVSAHAERLHEAYGGARLTGVQLLSFTALKTATPDPSGAVGLELSAVRSHAKYLLLEAGELTFVVHLMQGGRLRADEAQSRRPRNGLARWTFDDGRALLLTEAGTEKRAGIWVLEGDPLAQEPLASLGPEAPGIGPERLGELLASRSMRLHGFLRDQGSISGLGRRLANETCHRARLSPFVTTGALDADEVARLADAIHECVEESLAAERDRPDMSSSKERPSAVHGRAGEDCPTCGDEVRAVEYRRYTVNYCPRCQTGGRILADNTTSRFLR